MYIFSRQGDIINEKYLTFLTGVALIFTTSTVSLRAEIFSGGFTGATVTFVCEDGVSTADCNMLKTAADKWNNVNSKRKLSYDASKGQYNKYNALVKASTNYTTSNPSLLGEIVPGKVCTLVGGCNTASTNDVWTNAYLRVYKNNFTSTSKNLEIAKTAAHEFGHINSMAHTASVSIMRQGLSTDSQLKTFDNNEMYRKWEK